ncbi:MAG: hypothetical protein ACTSQJ_11060 [Promethearchaeota archaeon]
MKGNYLIFFYGYFVAQFILIYVNVYMPVYFFNVLNVNRTQLAFIQIFAYSAFFLKPLIAIYFDKEKSKKKLVITLSAFGILCSFILLIFNIKLLIIFGIFLGINFACISLLKVAIDKIIVEQSPNDKIRNHNALYTQLGALFGAIIPNLIFFLIYSDIYSIYFWNLFFFIGIICITPLILFPFILKDFNNNYKPVEKIVEDKVMTKYLILMCIFLFLLYADRLYEYPLEPWILNKYGEEKFSLFSFILIFLILLNAFGVILAGFISNKFNKKKILIFSSLMCGSLMIIAPFFDLIIFLILIGIIQIFAGFILINMISMMIDLSNKKVFIYQIMASFIILAQVVYIPLGTYLSIFIATEFIIILAGVLIIVSIIPISFIKI